jgi:hypothetical protein
MTHFGWDQNPPVKQGKKIQPANSGEGYERGGV